MRIRLPPELREKVEESASAAHRSLNSEIIKRLEESFARLDSAFLAEAIDSVADAAVEETRKEMAREMKDLRDAISRLTAEVAALRLESGEK